MKDLKQRYYQEVAFGGYTDIDGTIAFYSRINSMLDPSFVMLDLGCGRGSFHTDPVIYRKNLRSMKGKVSTVIGVDVDAAASGNPLLDEFRLIQGGVLPVEDDSIDVIICDNVLEHVPDPKALFREIRRVLRHEGLVFIRTPNRWSYISLASRIIPQKYHARMTSAVQDARDEQDVFPTVYRCNTVRALKMIMKAHGFDSVVYAYEAEPSYLSFSRLAYFFGVLHQRYAPRIMKLTIFAFGKLAKNHP